MTLKRRGFLGLLGGAIVAPLMPTASLGAASKAAYPLSALHAAIFQAKTRVNFSVHSLAQKLGLELAQAEQIMLDMSKRGILGPMQGSTQAGRWARSRVWRHPAPGATAGQAASRNTGASNSKTKAVQNTPMADLRPFLSHLYQLCQSQGMTLNPRCADLLKG